MHCFHPTAQTTFQSMNDWCLTLRDSVEDSVSGTSDESTEDLIDYQSSVLVKAIDTTQNKLQSLRGNLLDYLRKSGKLPPAPSEGDFDVKGWLQATDSMKRQYEEKIKVT